MDYNGFYALGVLLRSQRLSEGSLSALFAIMFADNKTYNFISEYFATGHHVTDEMLKRPECVVTILLALTNASLSQALKHSVLRVLHDIFLHLDKGKLQLIKNDAIELLSALLASEYEHKHLATETVDLDSPDAWQIEEDVMAFLRAICLYNCDLSLDANSLRFILLAINSLPLPPTYATVLQYRLIYDVLLFYQESSLSDTKLLVLFERLVILSIVHCGFLLDLLKERILDKDKQTMSPRALERQPSPTSLSSSMSAIPSTSSSSQLPSLSASTSRIPPPSPTFGPRGNSTLSASHGQLDWTTNPNLQYKDRSLVRLLVAITSYLAASETQSSIFGKLNKSIQRARQGVDQNFKWYFERYVYQLLLSPLTEHFVLSFIYTTLSDLDLAAVTSSESEFVARVIFYSKTHVTSGDKELATAARLFWKVALLKGKSYLSKIVYTPPASGVPVSDIFKIILLDTLPAQVRVGKRFVTMELVYLFFPGWTMGTKRLRASIQEPERVYPSATSEQGSSEAPFSNIARPQGQDH